MASIGTRLATTFVSATCTWTANDRTWATRRDSFASCGGCMGLAHWVRCLKFAHEHGAPWDEWTCALAAWNGNLECLKYAHENGCPWDEKTCDVCRPEWTFGVFEVRATRRVSLGRGDVRVCRRKWTFGVFEVRARERVSLGRGDVPYAAWNGHLECLKYAHENGCPWNEYDVREMPPRMDIWTV